MGPMPSELDELLPGSVVRQSLPVRMPNGTMSRVDNLPSVDWSMVHMHSLAATQGLAVAMEELERDILSLEQEAESFSSTALDVLKENAADWIPSSQLEALADLAEFEVEALETKMEFLKETKAIENAHAELKTMRSVSQEVRKAQYAAERRDVELDLLSKRYLDETEAREALERKIESERHRVSLELLETEFRTDTDLALMAEETRKRAAELSIGAKAIANRENEALELRKIAARGEESRQNVRTAVEAAFDVTQESFRSLLDDPALLGRIVGAILCILSAVIVTRQAFALLVTAVDRFFGKPALVRETSRRGMLRAMWNRLWRPARGVTLRDAGIVAPAALEDKIQNLVASIEYTRMNGAPLRHVLIYGPPGTGKSAIAQYLASACDLDCAIMSGGDLGPLGKDAVSELHRVFAWAKSNPRGTLFTRRRSRRRPW